MEQEQELERIYAEISAYEKEIAEHNEQFLKSLGKKAQKDFEELMEWSEINEKMKIVDAPKGIKQEQNCGIYKNIYVDQWCTNMEGDSFQGFIYANVKGQWIEVPFYC
jgi:predicted nuclease with TOPRIM domain